MQEPKLIERYLLLFAPWAISLIFSHVPIISFMTAWLGSFYIFHLSYSGKIKALPADLKVGEQLMRPLFLVQVIFAGYMSVSPIFNFLEIIGFINFDYNGHAATDSNQLELVARSQRYYCLGHASYVLGLFMIMRTHVKKYQLSVSNLSSFLMFFTLTALVASNAFRIIPGLSQFYIQLSSLSFISGTLALIYSFRAGRLEYISISVILFITNLTQSFLSGYKEPVIINFLVLGIFLFPFYKKLVLIAFLPIMLTLLFLLPTYNQVFREKAWANAEDSEKASDAAFTAAITSDDDEKESTAWNFLTGRLSEVQMFIIYMESTPSKNEYYGFEILWQSLEVVVPRIFWPSKPITEELVMERVYRAGVIARGSNVSAKPALIVDGYLSGGAIGIFITCLLFGAITQLISMKAEQLFGGYLIGTAIIFSGLFQIFWRGLSFEFLINSVVWSYVTMLIIFGILRLLNIIVKVDERPSN